MGTGTCPITTTGASSSATTTRGCDAAIDIDRACSARCYGWRRGNDRIATVASTAGVTNAGMTEGLVTRNLPNSTLPMGARSR